MDSISRGVKDQWFGRPGQFQAHASYPYGKAMIAEAFRRQPTDEELHQRQLDAEQLLRSLNA